MAALAPFAIPEQPDKIGINQGKTGVLSDIGKNIYAGATDIFPYLKAEEQKTADMIYQSNLNLVAGQNGRNFGLEPRKFLTSEQYENSPYKRNGVEFKDGVSEDFAKLNADQIDNDKIREDINSRIDLKHFGGIVNGLSNIAGGFANPLFYVTGGAVETTGMAVKASEALYKLLPAFKDATGVGAELARGFVNAGIHGSIAMPAFATEDYLQQKEFQEDADAWSILKAPLQGFAWGFGGKALGKVLGKMFSPTKLFSANIPDVKTATEPEIKPIESAKSETMQLIDPEANDNLQSAAVAQHENGKNPDLSIPTKQAISDKWEKDFGNDSRLDPDGFAKRIMDLKTNRDFLEKKAAIVDSEISELPEESPELEKKLKDKESLENAIDDHNAIIDHMENPPEKVTQDELDNYTKKMNSPDSDVKYSDVEIPKEQKENIIDRSKKINNELIDKRDEINKVGVGDLDEKKSLALQFHDDVKKCMVG